MNEHDRHDTGPVRGRPGAGDQHAGALAHVIQEGRIDDDGERTGADAAMGDHSDAMLTVGDELSDSPAWPARRRRQRGVRGERSIPSPAP